MPAGGREPSGTIKNVNQGSHLCHLDQNPREGTGSDQLGTEAVRSWRPSHWLLDPTACNGVGVGVGDQARGVTESLS